MKRFTVDENGVGTYKLTDDQSFTVDVAKFMATPELVAQAVRFAIGHVLRNATAGLMKDEHKASGYKEAVEGITNRIKSLAEGKWASVRQAGESAAGTLLAQALAAVMGCEVKDAGDFIDAEVEKALEAKGLDPDASGDELTPDQKKQRRQVIAGVHKVIGDDPAVAVQLTRIKAENAAKKAAEALEAAKGKESAFAGKATQ